LDSWWRARGERSAASRQPVEGQGHQVSEQKSRKALTRRASAADLQQQLDQRRRERDEALEQQAATSEVLKVISRSASDLSAALDTVLATACRLCHADVGTIRFEEGDHYRLAATFGCPPEWRKHFAGYTTKPDLTSVFGQTIIRGRTVHIPDVLLDPDYARPEAQKLMNLRAALGVPLVREGRVFGAVNLFRTTSRSFTPKQIALVETFTDQAVIAIENARLFEAEQQRKRELSEALEQQKATSEVLKIISSSPGELQPVFDTILANAVQICEARFGALTLFDGNQIRHAATYNVPPAFQELRRREPVVSRERTVVGRVVEAKDVVNLADVASEEGHADSALVKIAGARSVVGVPILKEDDVIGALVIYRTEVRPFSHKQVKLLRDFAAQAVIAIENTRLLNELRRRTDDLTESLEQQTATSEVLQVISRSQGELDAVFNSILENAVRICGARFANLVLYDNTTLRVAAMHNAPSEFEKIRKKNPIVPIQGSAVAELVKTRQKVHILDLAAMPAYAESPLITAARARSMLAVPMLKEGELIGGINIYRQEVKPFTDKQMVLLENFAAQAVIAIENTRLLNELRQRTNDLSKSLEDLRTTQDRLVQTEKLASLGQLTAGIAHEIKNPLNFVNNFSAVSVELIDELRQGLSGPLDDKLRAQISEIADMLQGNLDKVVQHGKRADAIVKNMLLHSRQGSAEHRPVDINALVEESLNLAYHGARAEQQGFNITLERSLDPAAGEVDVFPQDMTRVLLNLISNGFYAATKRKGQADGGDYEPTLMAATRNLGESVEIRIRDNGTGIPPEVKEQMFNPFYTTKPAGEGTGLGLSISHDIIVKQHGGSIEVDTQPGEFTEIKITLPRSGVFPTELTAHA
jgi:two-component system NtrC family sensor kinase